MSQQNHLYGARPPPNLPAQRAYEDDDGQQQSYPGSTTNLMNPSVQRLQDYGVFSQPDRDWTPVH